MFLPLLARARVRRQAGRQAGRQGIRPRKVKNAILCLTYVRYDVASQLAGAGQMQVVCGGCPGGLSVCCHLQAGRQAGRQAGSFGNFGSCTTWVRLPVLVQEKKLFVFLFEGGIHVGCNVSRRGVLQLRVFVLHHTHEPAPNPHSSTSCLGGAEA